MTKKKSCWCKVEMKMVGHRTALIPEIRGTIIYCPTHASAFDLKDACNRLSCEKDAILERLEYARRFLDAKDHDVAWVDEVLP